MMKNIVSVHLDFLIKAVEWGREQKKILLNDKGECPAEDQKEKNYTFDVGYQDRVDIAQSLFGGVPDSLTLEEAKEERLSDV